ncbi:hypothetical protein JKP88DRAFT_162326, partial [Tribonema minus]
MSKASGSRPSTAGAGGARFRRPPPPPSYASSDAPTYRTPRGGSEYGGGRSVAGRAAAVGRGGGGGGGGGARGAASAALRHDDGGAAAAAAAAVVAKVRQRCVARGGGDGLHALARLLRVMDNDGDGRLDRTELKWGLRDCGVALSAAELDRVCAHFDANGDGFVSFDEFLAGMRGPLGARRAALIRDAFAALDERGLGSVGVEELRGRYSCAEHPEVKSGAKTEAQVLAQFLAQWDTRDGDGRVSAAEFEDYYRSVSASIDDDDYFELMMRNAWRLSGGGDGWCGNTANRRVLVRGRDGGAERVEEIKGIAGQHARDAGDVRARLWRQGAALSDDEVELGGDIDARTQRQQRQPQQQQRRRQQQHGWEDPSPSPSRSPIDRGGDQRSPPLRRRSGGAQNHQVLAHRPGPGGGGSIERVRRKLLERGGAGLRGLARAVAIMDNDGDKRLTKEELKWGLQDAGVPLTLNELDGVFACFDRDRSGAISLEEFARGLRPPLSVRRRDLIHAAFATLDADGDGAVTAGDLARAYDASWHPLVRSGAMTAQDALREFLAQWDGDKDGSVTEHEFQAYYETLSALIDGDDYFELMMRNAWRLSGGGAGWCGNTANKRVLVRGRDGAERVEEIKGIAGQHARDAVDVRARLWRQG